MQYLYSFIVTRRDLVFTIDLMRGRGRDSETDEESRTPERTVPCALSRILLRRFAAAHAGHVCGGGGGAYAADAAHTAYTAHAADAAHTACGAYCACCAYGGYAAHAGGICV